MDDEANSSWVRRTNYSHTICHRLDSARYISIHAGLKSRPQTSNFETFPPKVKHRWISPLPETRLSESFKEARSVIKRFSTPHPRRVKSNKDIHREQGLKLKDKSKSNSTALKQFSSMKTNEWSKWSKYFDHGGGRVTSVETEDEWVADLSKLFLGLRFAYGAHSQLYHGIYNGEAVAVKIIRVPDEDENGVLGARLEKQFIRESTLLSRLHHPNVIKFIGACRKPLVFCVITEYLSEGSLRAYLHKLEHEHNPLPLEKLISIALDIAVGMEYIHSRGIIHRDLKPENVLINENFHMKIADFGIACEEASCDLLADDPGTYRWMAPEMIKRKSYGRKVDVYSFGLILWEMVTGAIPYEDMTPIQAAFAVVNKNARPPIPDDCPPALKALIQQCWSSHQEKRPEFWQIVKVLEHFESSLAWNGTITLVEDTKSHDHTKGLSHWIHKLGHHSHNSTTSSTPKSLSMPKFA